MINIDGSLFIQIINFIFLIWVLNLLVYKPIRNIILQRKTKISGLEEGIEQAESKATAQNAAFADGIKEARVKGLEEKKSLMLQGSEEEKQILNRINEKAQADLQKIKEKIAADAAGARAALMKEVESFADAISEKILGRTV